MDHRPLDGIRVLDLTVWQHGTYATAILSDLGADVIKVEERVSGDPGRHFWMTDTGLSSYFEAHNRGKRSVVIDLKRPEGRDVFLRLAAHADGFLNNFRIGAIARLGLAYEDVATVNPRIIYVQASGYGHLGDDAGLGSFDIIAQARGGIMSATGEPDDPPLPAGVPIADQAGAMQACIAMLTGLVSRNLTGKGMRLDTSLLGTQVALQSFNVTNYLFSEKLIPRRPRGGSTPFWRVYQAGDGEWFVIGMLLDRCWPEVTDVIGRPELLQDERFDTYRKRTADNAAALIAVLDDAFRAAPAREWVARLNAVGMFAAPVQDYPSLAKDPQVLANGYIHEVDHPGHDPVRMAGVGIAVDGEPVTVPRLSPQHGEHTETVLLEAGYTWDDIQHLREANIIGPATPA
ncbi:MAG: CoA transferase [Dehalococcoidia bacterium]